MSKLSTMFTRLFSQIRDTFQRIPVTTCIIMAEAIFVTVFFNNFEKKPVGWVAFFLFLFAAGNLLAECILCQKKTWMKWIGTGLTALTAGILASLECESICGLVELDDILSISNERVAAFIYGYIIICVVMSVYLCQKRSGLTFSQYLLQTFVEGAKTTIIYGVLCIGVLVLTGIIDALFLKNHYFELELRALFFVSVAYYGTGLVYSLWSPVKEITGFFRAIVRYVMLSICLAAFLIIYVYMLKIVIMWEIPSNQIFSILTSLFCTAMPISFMCMTYEKDTLLQKAAYILPYIFAPFLILQIYSVTARIHEHGLTPSRYMGIFMIVFEILYILWYLKWREKMNLLLPVIVVITAIITFVPGINMYTVSIMSQRHILTKYQSVDISQLSTEQIAKLKGAYLYLKSEVSRGNIKEESNTDLVTEDLKAQLEEADAYSDPMRHTITGYREIFDLDVTQYTHIYKIQIHADSDNGKKQDSIDAGALEINIDSYRDQTSLGVYDLEDMIQNYITEDLKQQEDTAYNGTTYHDISELMSADGIRIAPDKVLIPESLSLEYEQTDAEESSIQTVQVDYIDISGYMLSTE